ncbi:MAG: type II secretion system protein GspM [Pontixanthobacter sp.]
MTPSPTSFRDRIDLGALEPYWHRSRDWWYERSPRERILLGVLAALGVIALIVLLLLPIRQAREDALDTIRDANFIEARLRSGDPALARTGQFRSGTPSAIVTDSVAAAQLQVQQVSAEGTGVRVVLADAPFDAVMLWVADVESSSNLRVRSAQIDGQPAPGIVSATFVLSE